MEGSHLSSPALAPASGIDPKDVDNDTLSLSTVVQAKIMAGRVRRRRSLFEPEKREDDIGLSTLSHADFPASLSQSRASSKAGNSEESGFDKELIYDIIEHEVKQKLGPKTYDPAECEKIGRYLANSIKERISALEIKNYKFVCTFFISKRAKTSMKMDSGCAWDELLVTVDKDSFVDYVFQNDSISAVGTVYGVCCERPRSKVGRSASFPRTSRSNSLHI